MKVGIHQPNLFPWLGFFYKMFLSDVFVYLDSVTNNPKESIYTKRVQILSNKQAFWLTIPLGSNKEETYIPISEMTIRKDMLSAKKMLRLFEHSYSKCEFYEEVIPLVERFFNNEEEKISKRNIDFIEAVCERLEMDTVRKKSSEFDLNSSSNELLMNLTKECGGDIYLSGDGADGYQKPELFEEKGIGLEFMQFSHPEYPQKNTKEFLKGLSILDALMNIGFGGTRALLTKKALEAASA